MASKPLRIHDTSLRETFSRLDGFSSMLENRLAEYKAASMRLDCTLAMVEAEVAASLVESAIYEASLRLLSHGVGFDANREIARRLAGYRVAMADFEAVYGPLPCA